MKKYLSLFVATVITVTAVADKVNYGAWLSKTVKVGESVNNKKLVGWKKDNKWKGDRRVITAADKGVTFLNKLTTDSAFRQGLAIMGEQVTTLSLNGKELTPEKGMDQTYSLYLDKGENILLFKINAKNVKQAQKGKKKKRNKGGFVKLKLINLEYIVPTVADKIKNARMAITHIGRRNRTYKSKEYLAELDAIEKLGATDKAVEALRYKALVVNNPHVTFDEIIFRTSGTAQMPANWLGNSKYLRGSGRETHPTFNDEFKTLNLKSGKMKSIYKPTNEKEGIMDIALDYNAEKFLYSGVDTATNTFQLYEMNIDGSGKRLITPKQPTIDNYNGIYLPNGKILFCSTASLNSVPCVYGNAYVGTLFEIQQDGTKMRQVAFDQENDWYPWVKDNGRVMYSRWEYTDNAHYFTRILLEMNPDGTNNRSIYGSNSFWPNTLFYAKNIPGQNSKFSAIVSGHHGTARAGELIIFDSSKGDFEADGALQRIPGRGKKIEPVIIDNYMAGKWPRFLHPYPLSKDYFLVSGQLRPNDKWGLYVVDTFDNMIKIADADKHLFEPVPVAPRKRPPVIPEQRVEGAKDATLFIQDIYGGPGLEGVPRGTIKYLRIFTYGYAYRMSGGHDALAIEGGWDTKRVLGTVPVEADGSVMVKIPHSIPLSLQPLDGEGRALQVMRSWLAAQPGETVACIGCHEPSSMAPLSTRAIASTKPPRELTAWSNKGRIYGYSFQREIQPILDRYCVGCHDGTQKTPNFKDTSKVVFKAKNNPHFGKSYLALHPYVRRPGPESDMHLLTPMDYHASTSELIQILDKGHYGVKMDQKSREELATWIDLNIPYHGAWTEVRNDPTTQKFAELTVKYKKLYANIDDDIEWMPPIDKNRPKFIKPKAVNRPTKELKLAGWPLTDTTKQETKKIKIGEKEITLVKIPAGKYVMGSISGEIDEAPQSVVTIEKPFWMSTTEITNDQFRQFNPKHDSKVIDQQWKDHIYPGYPANKPEMPAIRVTWTESMQFCQWLSEQTGMKVTLPTESQWEWAARGGSDQPHYFNLKDAGKFANLADKTLGKLAVKGVNPLPVSEKARTPLNDFVPRDNSFNDGRLVPSGTGQYQANAWGLHDMIGNVAEWTRSDYKAYPYLANDGRNSGKLNSKKVARGGSWRDRPHRATASYRLAYESFQKVYNVGFRIIIEE